MSTPQMPTAYDPRRGNAVVAAALAEWKKSVREPPEGDPGPIREYLRTCGFSHPEKYKANGDKQWCGAFAGFCLVSSGVRPEVVEVKDIPEVGDLASTYRLWHLANSMPGCLITHASDMRPGDIASVGRVGKFRFGEHIVVFGSRATPFDDASTFDTYEGNATGTGFGGLRYEGVVRRTRPVMPSSENKGFLFGFRPHSGLYISEMHHG